MNRCIFE